MDRRTALEPGKILTVYEREQEEGFGISFQISREIGRGRSCIVYDASYMDSVKSAHFVRLKECYPCRMDIGRDRDGRLKWRPSQEQWMKRERERFVEAYKVHVEVSRKMGLINRVMHTFQIYYGNHTVYSVMDHMEGSDYKKAEREALPKMVKRMRAVAMTLEQYHKAGFLYLDIKPENIWIIDESDDLVYLFDHDSVVRMEALPGMRGDAVACTAGFEAPEVMSGDVEKIGVATDIYGLGALFYYRLMGTCPGRREREHGARYDFSGLKEENPMCRPLLFKRLQNFFAKTLAAARRTRFETMAQAIEELDELLVLCDDSAVYAVDNFVYHQNCFVARNGELEEIGRRLGEKHVLFLHGIGGIGKTELAARYGYENRERYNTMLFLRVEESLLESLCREDISLRNFAREEEEKSEEYVKRKLAALRACLLPEDLLIVDNLDEEDELLEELLELPCRIIVTSRLDYRDWNYPQMEVEELGGTEELMELFCAYNSLSYRQEEKEAIEDMIRKMDCHTMLTELLAKNLRVSGTSPLEMRRLLAREWGIAGLNSEKVRHRKDKRNLQASVQGHLKALFDTSRLGEEQISLLENLSLFAGVRIDRDLFLEWCLDGSAEMLRGLVQQGWVESGEDNKISLHQIVLDLIYGERKPEGGRSQMMARSMTRYAAEKPANRTQRDIRDKLCGIFGRRIQGKDKDSLDFYLAYCENIRYQRAWGELCLEGYGKHPEAYGAQLARVCFLEGREVLKELDSLECFMEEERQQEIIRNAVGWFEKAIEYRNEGQFLFSVGRFVFREMENRMTVEDSVVVEAYKSSLRWMEEGARIYEGEPGRDKKVLKQMYEELMDFYDPDALVLVRPDYFGDMEKWLYYGKKREGLGLFSGIADLHGVSYTQAGEQAERQGDVETAVKYYEMAAAADEEDMLFYEDKLGILYEELGEYGKAIAFFEDRYNREERGDTALHLSRLYGKSGEAKRAFDYLEKGMELCRQSLKEGNEGYWKEMLLEGYLEGARLPGERGEENWREGVAFYEAEEEYFRKERAAIEFQIRYGETLLEEGKEKKRPKDREKEQKKAGELLVDAGRNCLKHFAFDNGRKIVRLLENFADKAEDVLFRVQAFCVCARLVNEMDGESGEQERRYYEIALELLEENGLGKSADAMMVREELAGVYCHLELYEEEERCQRACDYERLAEWKAERLLEDAAMDRGERQKRQMEVWKDSGDGYREILMGEKNRRFKEDGINRDARTGEGEDDRLQKAGMCYQKAIDIWGQMEDEERQRNLYLFGRIMENWSDIEEMKGSLEERSRLLSRWHEELLEQYRNQYQRREQGNRDISQEMARLAERFEETGDRKKAVLCSFERGLAQLKTEYHGGDMDMAAGLFFRQTAQGIPEEIIDEVLEVCDTVAGLCDGAEGWEEFGEKCKDLARQYREEKISFKFGSAELWRT